MLSDVVMETDGLVAIAGDVLMACGADAQWRLETPWRIALASGAALFDVRDGYRFEVETPSGVVQVQGTRFTVRVEEATMKPAAMVGGGAALVTVGVIAGAVFFKPYAQPEGVRIDAGKEAAVTAGLVDVRAAEDAKRVLERRAAAAEAALEGMRTDLDQTKRRLADLEAALKTSEEAKAKLEEAARGFLKERGEKIGRALACIDDLKKQGFSAFLKPGVTSQLISDLRALDDEGVGIVLDLLRSEDGNARFLAAKLLEDLADPRSIAALKAAALEDKETMVMNMASHALALMKQPEALEALREILDKSGSEGAKVNAAYGLVMLGDEGGIKHCLDWMRDPEFPAALKGALAPGIFILTDPRTMPIADEVVKLFRDNSTLMGMAVDYYKAVATPEARVRLQNIANDASLPQAIRDAAIEALR